MQTNHYTNIAIGLHWLMAILLIGMFGFGLYMTDLPLSPSKLQLYAWHKWLGVTAFLLIIFRLVWRITHQPPELTHNNSRLLSLAAQAMHSILYFLMFAIPISGWLMSSAKGFQTVYFGILPLPDLLSKDKELGDILKTLHETLNYLFIVLVIAHCAAALKHHFIDKDAVLSKILFSKKS